jgi:hypothetical protein
VVAASLRSYLEASSRTKKERTVNIWNTPRASSPLGQLRIDDLPAVGQELTDEDLQLAAGGFEIIIEASGGGTCTFDDDFDFYADQ